MLWGKECLPLLKMYHLQIKSETLLQRLKFVYMQKMRKVNVHIQYVLGNKQIFQTGMLPTIPDSCFTTVYL